MTGFPPGILDGVADQSNPAAAAAQFALGLAMADAYQRVVTTTLATVVDVGGLTLGPGVYAAPSSLAITGTLVLDGGGDVNAFFLFRIGSTLVTASQASVVLINGASPRNVIWLVGSSATLGTYTSFTGVILATASVTFTTGSAINGAALAKNGAITLDSNLINGTSVNCVKPPPLAASCGYGVLAHSTITNTGPTILSGLALSPGTAVTGFPPGINNGGTDVANAAAAAAQVALGAAMSSAASLTPTTTLTTAVDIGGLRLSPGVYAAPSSLFITGVLVLDGGGNSNALFVFQIGSTLVTASYSLVSLTNGAAPNNVIWDVGSSATIGTYSTFAGIIMATASITITTGSTIQGAALAHNAAVTMDTNVIYGGWGCAASATATVSPAATVSPTVSAVATSTATSSATPAPTLPCSASNCAACLPGSSTECGVCNSGFTLTGHGDTRRLLRNSSSDDNDYAASDDLISGHWQ